MRSCLLIRADGRTERMRDGEAAMVDGMWLTSRIGDGPYTLHVIRGTVVHGYGLRNIPASLLLAQLGAPVVLLAGPVAITHDADDVSDLVTDTRWTDLESLVEDITRAIHGLEPSQSVAEPAWPHAIRLAAAFLEDRPRPIPADPDLSDADAVDFLTREFGFEGLTAERGGAS